MSDDTVTIEVDGCSLDARKGAMLIEVTDAAGIYIPRFCYHKHLSVAANCRMCLVDVERAPKPLPACATPVMDGMKVFTRSARAVDAQRATMEFLLINHPLDCPICDQGGECELQDLAMAYGDDVSRYAEGKRVVRDKDIGPLVQTDMTRCIHCTRCVRFGEEIAGLRELGATGRGEHMEIGTYVSKAMRSELSGNVIDLCPVGALTSKPYRYSARAWELRQHDGIAPHDCLGSNIHFHVKGDVVKRVVPKDNEALNETWLSDRDRFSYEALASDERLLRPRIKRAGEWQDCDWDIALEAVSGNLNRLQIDGRGEEIGALAAPSSTTEEFYLLRRLMNALGSANIDHRLRQLDFAADASAPRMPSLGVDLHTLESADAILLIGANPRADQPLINHRIRKAALNGADVVVVNPIDYDFNYPVRTEFIAKPSELVATLGAIARSAASEDQGLSASTKKGLAEFTTNAAHDTLVANLRGAERAVVITGNYAQRHRQFSVLSTLARIIAAGVGASWGQLTDGANAAGAWLAGAVPHRGPGGEPVKEIGLNARAMFDKPLSAYLLLGIEPEFDCLCAQQTIDSLRAADFVVAFSAFQHASLELIADVLLPVATFAENEGSYVNCVEQWQAFNAAVRPRGDARPSWKVLQALANRLSLTGFDAVNVADITRDINARCDSNSDTRAPAIELPIAADSTARAEAVVEIPTHVADPIARRGQALQAAQQLDLEAVYLNAATVKQLGLRLGGQALIKADGAETVATVAIDEMVSDGRFLLYAGHEAARTYSGAERIQITKA